MRVLSWIVILAFIFGCTRESKEVDKNVYGYISILEFIAENFELQTEQSVLIITRENGITTDSAIIENYQFQNDLEVLSRIDISGPSLFGKYTVDSLDEGGFRCIQYEAISEKQSVKELKVCMLESNIVEIEAIREHSSLIAFIKQTIVITKDSYEIKSTLKEKPGGAQVYIEKTILKQ